MHLLEIIVPVKNETGNVERLVQRIYRALNLAKIPFSLTFVDDGSTDGTISTLKRVNKIFPLKILQKEGRSGKAFSIFEAVSKSSAKIFAMIDGDLQYPPEAIPQMYRDLNEYGVVVAKRKSYSGSYLRKAAHSVFSNIFGKRLFGISADVQSGLKLFRRDIIDNVDKKNVSAWTLDLPLLQTALDLSYKIGEVEIDFDKRNFGKSKINFIKSSSVMAAQTFKLKASKKQIYNIKPSNGSSMMGAGFIQKGKRYVTHTVLEHQKSALETFYPWQQLFIGLFFALILWGLIANLLLTLQIIIAALSLVYFSDVLFNFYLVFKSLHAPPEISFSDEKLHRIENSNLPIYSILCPLYREAHVLPGFLEAIAKLDWPKEKLDVQLLLEEDDLETIDAARGMNLPSYVRITVVPDSLPKTKPKACNFGLSKARGEYVVVYDAEDIPEPLQLKKAYLAFQELPKNVICLQAKLNYFNPSQNILTRLFTAEYSLWFDVVLPGFQSIETNIPLGGTSNHFKKASLMEVKGWDPFNVTEDCDLGVRLFTHGYKTAIIDSTTLEEANSRVGNWLRQRSRWIKGYMQTYLVHMRNPIQLIKSEGWHALIFQLVVGGRIIFSFINPILWIVTILYFTFYAFIGSAVEALFPPGVFYLAAFSLVFGNFLYMYYYMIGCAKREHYTLIKFVFLIPFYWLMLSVASVVALYQLLTKPHYWEKTVHGLHLGKVKVEKIAENLSEEIIEDIIPDVKPQSVRDSIRIKLAGYLQSKRIFVSGGLFILASVIANFSNFVFNAFFGRTLSFEDYGLLSLFISFQFILAIPISALSSTVAHRSAYLLGKYSKGQSKGYFNFVNRPIWMVSLLTTLLWVASITYLARFFHTDSIFPFLLFAPYFLSGLLLANLTGFLTGSLSFGKIGFLFLLEALTKLGVTAIVYNFGLGDWAVLAIPTSIIVPLAVGYLFISREKSKPLFKRETYFDTTFFLTSILSGVSLISFFGLDVVMAKHFLSPSDAGKYGLLSLVGKISFFISYLFIPFIIPLVSKNEGEGKDSNKSFSKLFALTIFFSLTSAALLTGFSARLVPLLFGERTLPILYLLPLYMSAVVLFCATRPVLSFFQAKKNYSFAIFGVITFFVQIVLVNMFHSNLEEFVKVMFLVSSFNALGFIALYLSRGFIQTIGFNLSDLYRLFSGSRSGVSENSNLSKILIFNWRDSKHAWAGGAESYIHELAKVWVKTGNEVTVFCGNDQRCLSNEQIDGVNIVRRGGFYTVYIWAFLYYIFKFRGKFDLVIDSANGIPFFTPLYVNAPKFLLIHHVHQEVFRAYLNYPKAILAGFIESKLMPLVYRDQKVITVSESSKKEILKIKLSKKAEIEIINPGVELSNYRKSSKTILPSFLYLGRLKPYKNVDIAIKAFANVVKKYPAAKFLIAGTGESFMQLKNLVSKMSLQKSVKVLGRITEREKYKLLSQSWVVLQPSEIEGWGITVIEANASGTPVIASDVNGLRDSVLHNKTGLLVKSKNVNEFSKAMVRLISNTSLRRRLSKESLTWAQRFDWNNTASKFYSIIELHYANIKGLEYSFAKRDI